MPACLDVRAGIEKTLGKGNYNVAQGSEGVIKAVSGAEEVPAVAEVSGVGTGRSGEKCDYAKGVPVTSLERTSRRTYPGSTAGSTSCWTRTVCVR